MRLGSALCCERISNKSLLEAAPYVALFDEVVEFLRQQFLGLLERLREVIESFGTVVHVVLHRSVCGAVEGLHHVFEQRVAGRRRFRVGLDDGFEFLRALLSFVFVRNALIDAEPAAAVLAGE